MRLREIEAGSTVRCEYLGVGIVLELSPHGDQALVEFEKYVDKEGVEHDRKRQIWRSVFFIELQKPQTG